MSENLQQSLFGNEQGSGKSPVYRGGFPCQPHSVAGKRLASADERDLWGEFARVICETKPKWVLGENVPGLLTSESGRFFGRILRDLAEMGYSAGWGVISARSVGTPHERERVFIIANANGERQEERYISDLAARSGLDCWLGDSELANSSQVTDAQTNPSSCAIRGGWKTRNDACRSGWKCQQEPAWAVPKSELVRMAHGLSNGMDALGCLGNAVVPQQVYPILQAIADIEALDS